MKNLICAVTLLAVSTAQAATIYVDVNCPGPDNVPLPRSRSPRHPHDAISRVSVLQALRS